MATDAPAPVVVVQPTKEESVVQDEKPENE